MNTDEIVYYSQNVPAAEINDNTSSIAWLT